MSGGAWAPCPTGNTGAGLPYLTSGGLPTASGGPGLICGWRLTVSVWAVAGSYPGRGCGGCIDAAGGGCFSITGSCTPVPTSYPVAISIGFFGICPATVEFSSATVGNLPVSPTGGAWVQVFQGTIPGEAPLGTVTAWVNAQLCLSSTSTPPIESACYISPPPLEYGAPLGETCEETFPADQC